MVVFTVPRCCLRPQIPGVAEERTVAKVKVAESAVFHLRRLSMVLGALATNLGVTLSVTDGLDSETPCT